MPNRPSSVFLWCGSTLLLTLVVFLSVRFLDVPLAYFVRDHLYVNLHWSRLTSDLPDLLLQLVVFSSSFSLVFYRVRVRRGIDDNLTRLARLVTWAAPVSYLGKSLLKMVFGRGNTRMWLQEPGLYGGFHWFTFREGFEGFPSGHMAVVVTLLAALWRYYPKWRFWYLAVGAGLGAALVATNYHFLSDVVAGTWLGVLLETIVYRVLLYRPLGSR